MLAMLGPCVELRPLLPTNAAELASCVEANRKQLEAWAVVAQRVTDVETGRALLEQYAEPARYFGIWVHGVLNGAAVYRTFDVQTSLCEMGGWLIPQGQGHGLITLAFRQMIAWAFDVHGMYRVELRASPDNIRACRIAQRLGMTREEVLRSAFALNGNRHDSEVWSLLATERP